MKKILIVIAVLCLIPAMTGCGKKTGLVIYIPTEYIDTQLIKDFERDNDIKVKMQTFESNEEAHRMVSSESFDLVFPSDYMIEQLAKEDLIAELDYSKISNYSDEKLVTQLKNSLTALKDKENGFDFLKYAVPYFWGNVGLIYDTDKVSLTDLETNNWNILSDTSYDVAFYNSARDAYMIAFMSLGYDSNTSNVTEIDAATNWLKTLISNGKSANSLTLVTDEILDCMPYPDTNKYDIAVAYSGDAAWIMSENSQLDYYLPSNGTNVFVDGMVIPKNANHEDMAYKFINYMWEEACLSSNTLEVGYTSPSQVIYDSMTASDGDYYDNNAYLVRFSAVDQMFRYNPAAVTKISAGWLEASVE